MQLSRLQLALLFYLSTCYCFWILVYGSIIWVLHVGVASSGFSLPPELLDCFANLKLYFSKMSVLTDDERHNHLFSYWFSVVDNKFVRESVTFSNQFTSKGEAANEFYPRPKKGSLLMPSVSVLWCLYPKSLFMYWSIVICFDQQREMAV